MSFFSTPEASLFHIIRAILSKMANVSTTKANHRRAIKCEMAWT